MAITASDLIAGRKDPVTCRQDMDAFTALKIMLENDYSQLPIVDHFRRQYGIVTAEGILRAQVYMGASLNNLHVSHVTDKARLISSDDNILEVFDYLHESPAVLVVDTSNKLLGIITSWDAASFLKQRTIDLIMIEDIEQALKDHITWSAQQIRPGSWETFLNELSERIKSRKAESIKYTRRLIGMLAQTTAVESVKKLSDEEIEAALEKVTPSDKNSANFSRLNMSNYIDMLLSKDIWAIASENLKIEANYLRRLLDSVREIRNQLAHFRGTVTTEQRQILQYASRIFTNHTVPNSGNAVEILRENLLQSIKLNESNIQNDLTETQSRYFPLGQFLSSITQDTASISVTFEQIDAILGFSLPKSALEHRSWWANDYTSHVQSQQWLNADWKVSHVDFNLQKVEFSRISERARKYKTFFRKIRAKFLEVDQSLNKSIRVTGESWINVEPVRFAGKSQIGVFSLSFTSDRRFRIELYIDSGEKNKNKAIFNRIIENRQNLENTLREALSWESMENKRACRIAIYAPGSIEDSDSQLSGLIEWAANRFMPFKANLLLTIQNAVAEIEATNQLL
ncbi:MAG: DUF4268 domain-containing protein [Pleurocapsa minor GSE-CHR-MK-17-07R]|jgi:CBS domain-containing protein|nr:DUF4268 domain-containing protein [Pleurocapsa minor GSE-CHR-MK 17-07R]